MSLSNVWDSSKPSAHCERRLNRSGNQETATCHLLDWQQEGGLIMNMLTASGESPPCWQHGDLELSRAQRGDQAVQAAGHTNLPSCESSSGLPRSAQPVQSSRPSSLRVGTENCSQDPRSMKQVQSGDIKELSQETVLHDSKLEMLISKFLFILC